MDGHRVVQHAVEEAQRLADGWQAPAAVDLKTAGAEGLSRKVAELEQAHIAGQITQHDVVVGQALAQVLCGGGEPLVSQQRLLDLEREQFLALCATVATRERIVHMLDTGKPLSN
jgi:3-hydroxyacyl-CoA dehydrogenase